jgi:hypothetical protein
MKVTDDGIEWRDWARDWQGAPPAAGARDVLDWRCPERLRRRMLRQRRVLVLTVILEVVITLVFGAFAVDRLLRGETFGDAALGLFVLGILAVTWVFAWVNRRGTWGAAGESVRDHARLWLRRAERRISSLRFAWGLLVAELAFFACWFVWLEREAVTRAPLRVVVWFGLFSVAFCAALAALEIGARRDHQAARSLWQEVGGDGPDE